MQLTSQQKQNLSAIYPELRDWFELKEISQTLEEIKSRLENIENVEVKSIDAKVEQSLEIVRAVEKMEGQPGYTPVKGIDYVDGENYNLTEDDKLEIAQSIEVPIVEKIIEIQKQPITKYITKYVENKITPSEIVEMVNMLTDSIDSSVIKDVVTNKQLDLHLKPLLDGMVKFEGRVKAVDQRWHGAGLSRVSHDATLTGDGTGSNPLSVVASAGYSILVATGTIDDSNVSFTFLQLPTEIVINGLSYIQTGGSYTWTWNAGTLTATLSIPVGTGGSIYGRK